jgi:hypothetical protein
VRRCDQRVSWRDPPTHALPGACALPAICARRNLPNAGCAALLVARLPLRLAVGPLPLLVPVLYTPGSDPPPYNVPGQAYAQQPFEWHAAPGPWRPRRPAPRPPVRRADKGGHRARISRLLTSPDGKRLGARERPRRGQVSSSSSSICLTMRSSPGRSRRFQ